VAPTQEEQDGRDADSLYSLIEEEVLPLFHDRDERGIPQGWVDRIRASLASIGPRFCATRMVEDYVRGAYRVPETRSS